MEESDGLESGGRSEEENQSEQEVRKSCRYIVIIQHRDQMLTVGRETRKTHFIFDMKGNKKLWKN